MEEFNVSKDELLQIVIATLQKVIGNATRFTYFNTPEASVLALGDDHGNVLSETINKKYRIKCDQLLERRDYSTKDGTILFDNVLSSHYPKED